MSNTSSVDPWGGRVPSASEIQDQKKEEILKATALYFSRHGYHSTSLKDVAKSLGIAKSLLYYYFKDKHSLLYECSVAAHNSIQFVPNKYNNSEEFIAEFFESMISYIKTVNLNNFQFVMFMEPDVFTTDQLDTINGLRDRFEATVRAMIADGQRLGALIQADVRMMGFSIIGAANWVARWWRSDGERSIDDLAAELVHLSLRGLAVAPNGVDAYMLSRNPQS